ncbi:MAG: response regulator [Alphaproteobacteria bacterium]|nr:response regulator [Alphaproteobacteria bacterium]MBF0251725.1 response regulator [Alphaproteobacteria bacterium]
MAHSVLIVEDEPNIALSLQFIMKRAGHVVRVAGDGDAALQAMAAAAPDVVLLDIMLPKRDGLSVCEAIRANAAWKGVKILVLSAKSRESDREKALGLGADDYLTKPYSTRDVCDRVNRMLGLEGGCGPSAGAV